MTEAEWLACEDMRRLLKHLRRPPGDRKLRLLLCHCCHRVWHRLGDRCRAAVEVAQRFADGLAQEEELTAARNAARTDQKCYGVYFAYSGRTTFAEAALACNHLAYNGSETMQVELAGQLALVHELFGNPFRPVSFVPSWSLWQGGAVGNLARAIYDDSSFDELAVLADALEEAGCTHADLLTHLRYPGPHVRGCWALDLILGKS